MRCSGLKEGEAQLRGRRQRRVKLGHQLWQLHHGQQLLIATHTHMHMIVRKISVNTCTSMDAVVEAGAGSSVQRTRTHCHDRGDRLAPLDL